MDILPSLKIFIYLLTSMIGEGTIMQRTVIIISNGVLLWLGTVIISNGGGVGLVFIM